MNGWHDLVGLFQKGFLMNSKRNFEYERRINENTMHSDINSFGMNELQGLVMPILWHENVNMLHSH